MGINKFYPKNVKYRPDGSLNPDWINPDMNAGQYIFPPTDKDATRYVVPKASDNSATVFSKYRQGQDEYVVPIPRGANAVLREDGGDEFYYCRDEETKKN